MEPAQNDRHNAGNEQYRSVKSSEVGSILILGSLEVHLADEERGPGVESRETDLAVGVARGDLVIRYIGQVRGKSAELLPIESGWNEAQAGILGDTEVGFVLDEVVVRSKEAERGAADVCSSGIVVVIEQVLSPKCIGGQILWEWFEEYSIVDPYEMQLRLRILGEDDVSPLYSLSVQCGNVFAVLLRHAPQIRCNSVEVGSTKLLLE